VGVVGVAPATPPETRLLKELNKPIFCGLVVFRLKARIRDISRRKGQILLSNSGYRAKPSPFGPSDSSCSAASTAGWFTFRS
jgi:hypothetical protein